ncbi:MAG: phosphatase PAP2 family protein [Succinivibrionaceae bacterium]|nr:phosphatase PAP2 family protein [Succinivibrionaceae bacterium]
MEALATSTIPFLHTLANLRLPALTWLLEKLTYLGDEKLFVVISLIVFWCFSKRGGLYMLTTGFGVSSVGQALKLLFRIPRPWLLDPEMESRVVPSARESNLLGEGADGWSFPSGHTLISVGTYGGMAAWFQSRALRIIGIVLAVLIPFSRLYLGVHTPLDILCGALLALAAVLALRPIFQSRRSRKIRAALIGSVLLSAIMLVITWQGLPAGLTEEESALYASGVKNLWQLMGATPAVWLAFEVDRKWTHFTPLASWKVQILKIAGGSFIVLALQVGVQKLLGYAKPITVDNMTRNGLIVCLANFLALTGGMTFWPMAFRKLAERIDGPVARG